MWHQTYQILHKVLHSWLPQISVLFFFFLSISNYYVSLWPYVFNHPFYSGTRQPELTCRKAQARCCKTIREENQNLWGEKCWWADELAGQEAPEEPGILVQAGREQTGNREGPWSRGRNRQREKVAHMLSWQSDRDILTAGPYDGSFPKFRTFFLL